jgi:hypothetical protein
MWVHELLYVETLHCLWTYYVTLQTVSILIHYHLYVYEDCASQLCVHTNVPARSAHLYLLKPSSRHF